MIFLAVGGETLLNGLFASLSPCVPCAGFASLRAGFAIFFLPGKVRVGAFVFDWRLTTALFFGLFSSWTGFGLGLGDLA